VTPGPTREEKYAIRAIHAKSGEELQAVESLRDQLKVEPELVILFGDAIKSDKVRQLVAFGDSLGIPVKYVCLVDYANSRGASDMGLLPHLTAGYQAVENPGLSLPEMLQSDSLDLFWVVGANPLKDADLASKNTFIVVQDMFLTETAKKADIVLPASSAYEKNGTVTNVTGEVQRLTAGASCMGTKPDLDIFGILAREMKMDLGPARADHILNEIRQTVRGYSVPLPVIATGGAAHTSPVNGFVPVDSRPELIRSACDTLFTSGTLGRYSKMLTSVLEYPGELYKG
jgi:NADH-quinone oxidoreductase subunit G